MGRKTKMNRLTSPELLAQVNPENMTLLEDFLEYLRSTQHSEQTCHGYRNDIEIFLVWNLQNCGNKHFTKVTKREIVKYQDWLLNNNENSPARVRRLKSALSSLSNYVADILDDEFEDFRPIVQKIKSPPNKLVREKTVWKDEELEALLQQLTSSGQHKKACLLALAMYGGRRKAELTRFKVSHFDEENIIYGSLYKTPEPIKTKGTGGGKMLVCYTLVKGFKPYFDLWMEERKRLGIESEWLFPDAIDPTKPMASTSLNSMAITFSRMTGRDFYWHSTRHRWVTALAQAGIPDDVIQKLLGWENVAMCQIYKDIDAEDEFGKYFSDGEIVAQEKKSLQDL